MIFFALSAIYLRIALLFCTNQLYLHKSEESGNLQQKCKPICNYFVDRLFYFVLIIYICKRQSGKPTTIKNEKPAYLNVGWLLLFMKIGLQINI